jgi:hypothetical protein
MKKIMVFTATVIILTTLTGCSVTLGHDKVSKYQGVEDTLVSNRGETVIEEEVITEHIIEENIISEQFIDEEYENELEYNSQTNEY